MIRPLPVLLLGERFWRKAFDVEFLVDEGMIAASDAKLFSLAETAPRSGKPLRTGTSGAIRHDDDSGGVAHSSVHLHR